MNQIETSRPFLAAPAPPAPSPRDDDVDLAAIPRILWRRLPFAIVVWTVVMAAATPAILAIEPVYYAATRFLLRESFARSLLGPEFAAARIDVDTEVERLRSRRLALEVIDRLELEALPELNPALRETGALGRLRAAARALVLGAAEAPGADGAADDPAERVATAFEERLVVYRRGASRAIEIGFTAQDPMLAARVANVLLETFLEERRVDLARELADAVAWLDARIEAQRRRAAAAAAAAEDAAGAVAALGADAAGTVAQLGARRAQIALLRAEIDSRTAALARAAAADERLAALDPEIAAPLRADLHDARARLREGEAIFGAGHPTILRAVADLGAVEAAIEGEAARSAEALRLRREALDRESATIAAALDDARDAERQAAIRRDSLARLDHAAREEREALSDLLARRRMLDDKAAIPVEESRVLNPATAPLAPQSRGRLFYLAAAAVAAGALAVAAAFVREALDGSVRGFAQLRDGGRTTAAGLIPLLARRRRIRGGADVVAALDGPFGDAVARAALAIERLGDGEPPRSLMVAPALPGDGATTVAAALAAMLVRRGWPTLLVDADARRGRVAALFGDAAQPGLSETAAARAGAEAAIRQDPGSGVAYAPRDVAGADPSARRRTIEALLAKAAREKRVVIFDGPPVLSSADAAWLAGRCEATLLVVAWGRTPVARARFALDEIRAAGGGPVLVAINRVDPARYRLYGHADGGVFDPAAARYRDDAARA